MNTRIRHCVPGLLLAMLCCWPLAGIAQEAAPQRIERTAPAASTAPAEQAHAVTSKATTTSESDSAEDAADSVDDAEAARRFRSTGTRAPGDRLHRPRFEAPCRRAGRGGGVDPRLVDERRRSQSRRGRHPRRFARERPRRRGSRSHTRQPAHQQQSDRRCRRGAGRSRSGAQCRNKRRDRGDRRHADARGLGHHARRCRAHSRRPLRQHAVGAALVQNIACCSGGRWPSSPVSAGHGAWLSASSRSTCSSPCCSAKGWSGAWILSRSIRAARRSHHCWRWCSRR